MKTTPISERLLVPGSISELLAQPEGSVDEGVQTAPAEGQSDTRVKKIWVYADNVFSPMSASDFRTVRVQTAAFDLSGWIDFTKGQPQDQFTTEVRVTMAHASSVLVQLTGFGTQMAKFKDMTGQDTIVGNHVEITIRQTHSQDNFATKIPIAYQFVVESR